MRRKPSHFRRPCLECGRPCYFERCDLCAPEFEAARQVYDSSAWKRARKACLERDRYRCTVVEKTLENPRGVRCTVTDTRELDAHHTTKLRELVKKGLDPTDLRHLRTVCKRHHRMLETILDRGLSTRTDAPPHPLRVIQGGKETSPQLRLVSDRQDSGDASEEQGGRL